MPHFTMPAGGVRRTREFNKCHNPKGDDGGQFCSEPVSHDTTATTATLTSYRGKDQPGPGDRSNKAVFKRMHALAAALEQVGAKVTAQPVQGAWAGAWEPSWMVGIDPDSDWDTGATQRVLAAMGKQYNQDAVLLMHRCLNDCNSVYVDMRFASGVGQKARDAIGEVFGAAGLSGWTWFKDSQGRTTVRMANVPAWSRRTTEQHLDVVARVRAAIAAKGYTTTSTKSRIRVEVFEREARTVPIPGVRSYDEVLHPPRAPGRQLPALPSSKARPPGMYPGAPDFF